MTDERGGPDGGTEMPEEECPLSQRVDGKKHTWRFDGNDPYVFCHWCGQYQDALTGRVIRLGRRGLAQDAAEREG